MAVSNTLMVLHWVFRNQMAQLTQSPGKEGAIEDFYHGLGCW